MDIERLKRKVARLSNEVTYKRKAYGEAYALISRIRTLAAKQPSDPSAAIIAAINEYVDKDEALWQEYKASHLALERKLKSKAPRR
jgi:hypothetical protein